MKRLIVGASARITPRGATLATLAAALAAVVLAAAWLYGWARWAGDEARVLSRAATVLDAPVPLDRAADVMWAFAMEQGGAGDAIRLPAFEPPLPPGLCLDDDTTELGGALRALDAAITGGGGSLLERRISEVRFAPLTEVPAAPWVRAYSIARGHLAAGDPVTAAQALAGLGGGPLGADRVPVVGPARAPALVGSGTVDSDEAAAMVLARYLAGVAAMERGAPAAAIPHLRFAINALAYLIPPAEATTASSSRVRRITVDGGRFACGTDSPQHDMDSMDPYVALVASYLLASGFTDPTRLTGELHRSALEIDPADPLAPVLSTAAGGGREVPEHLLWAASNLQRVEHHNRVRPDPRLGIARAVLVLRLTDTGAPFSNGDEGCAMLAGVAGGAAGTGSGASSGASNGADSALAVVTLAALSRHARRCGGGFEVSRSERSRLLGLGGHQAAGGLPGRYDALHGQLVRSLADGGGYRGDFEVPLETVTSDRVALERGRIPHDLLLGLDTDDAAAAVDAWLRAVFQDVAEALVVQISDPAGGRRPAGEARALLEALNGSLAHAGLRPAGQYGPGQVMRVARAGGPELVVPHLSRYLARSYPWLSALLLAMAALTMAFAALVVHVSWWRYELTTSRRFYFAETLEQWRREMGDGGASGDRS